MVSEIYAPSALYNPILDIVGQRRESQRSLVLHKFYVKNKALYWFDIIYKIDKLVKIISIDIRFIIIFYIKKLFVLLF